MKKMLLMMMLCAAAVCAGERLKTTQPVNYLREGPASYYDVVTMIEGSVPVEVIERKGSWIKVRTDAKETGWLSENSFAKRADQKNETLTKGKTTTRASRAELAAAVKGFAKKYVPEGTEQEEKLNKYESRAFTQDEMETFENSFTVQPYRGYMSVEKPFDLQFHEDAIGLGIAQRIAAGGLTTDRVATAYVNMIANYVAKYTRAYDVTFRVAILADQKVNALSCPGGYIFITEGLLKQCANEAELAAIIAHEMGHVVQRHGLKELHLRQPKINSEAAFEELSDDVGEEATDDEKELDQYADEAFENVVRPRLITYEYEADQLAMTYLKRAGYDQTAELSILSRMQQPLEQQTDIFASNYMTRDDVRDRIQKVKQTIQSERWTPEPKKQFADRFKKYTSGL
jgi:beta-barrel assembly-enhancing protease